MFPGQGELQDLVVPLLRQSELVEVGLLPSVSPKGKVVAV